MLLGILPAIAYGLIHQRAGGQPSWIRPGPRPGPGCARQSLDRPRRGRVALPSLFPSPCWPSWRWRFWLAWFISRLGAAPRRAAVPWLCGYAREAECNRYVAHGYYGEIKRYFRWLGGAPAPQPEKSADLKEP